MFQLHTSFTLHFNYNWTNFPSNFLKYYLTIINHPFQILQQLRIQKQKLQIVNTYPFDPDKNLDSLKTFQPAALRLSSIIHSEATFLHFPQRIALTRLPPFLNQTPDQVCPRSQNRQTAASRIIQPPDPETLIPPLRSSSPWKPNLENPWPVVSIHCTSLVRTHGRGGRVEGRKT